jgi:hypothetical protein
MPIADSRPSGGPATAVNVMIRLGHDVRSRTVATRPVLSSTMLNATLACLPGTDPEFAVVRMILR